MHVVEIDGCTRVVGASQGYNPLPLRDVTATDDASGQVCPAMESAWALELGEEEALKAGGRIILRVLGNVPPPVAIYVENVPQLGTAAEYHARFLAEFLPKLVSGTLSVPGATWSDLRVMLESLTVGVLMVVSDAKHDAAFLDRLQAAVKQRLAEKRLDGIEPAGTA